MLWERLTEAAGIDARDAVWNHPDLMPSSSDLDEPAGFIDRIIGGDVSSADIDSLIEEIQEGLRRRTCGELKPSPLAFLSQSDS